MNWLYLLPFSYFYQTRLQTAQLGFHLAFEWLAALFLVGCLTAFWQGVFHALACYAAFISLYEIGYLINDICAAPKETQGRQRAPAGVRGAWLCAWILTRLGVFLLLTFSLHYANSLPWWTFFAALSLAFALHNSLLDAELKCITFLWLAWFRFLAPVFFVVPANQRMGISLAAAMSYVAFRWLAYLDSKALLSMTKRQHHNFRVSFFLMPLIGALALCPYPEARGFLLLTGYYAAIALLIYCLATLGVTPVKPQE